MGETWHWDRLWPSAPGEPRGDKPSLRRGRRVRAFLGALAGLESLQTVPNCVEGEQGVPRQAFACVGQRVAHCPCLHPLLAALSLPMSPPLCLGALAGTATFSPAHPGWPGGAEPPAALAPKPTRGRNPACSSEHMPAAAVPGWWLPPAGIQLQQRLARHSRAARSRLLATGKCCWRFARPCGVLQVIRTCSALAALCPAQRGH